MKKCLIMFVFFVVMLFVAALSDKTEVGISEDNVDSYANAEMLFASD